MGCLSLDSRVWRDCGTVGDVDLHMTCPASGSYFHFESTLWIFFQIQFRGSRFAYLHMWLSTQSIFADITARVGISC